MKTSPQTSQQFIKIFLTLCLLMTLFANHVTLASAEQNMQTPTDPGVTDLVSWWTLDETSGTREDSHADNDLGENNSVSYSSGKQNNSAEFNGTNQSLQVSDNSSISMGNNDFTIGGWVNIDTLTHLRALMGKGPSNGANVGYEYILEYDPGPNEFWFSVGNGTTYGSITDFTPSTSTWYFLVAWHDSANDMLYLQVNNGTPASASYSSGSYDSSHNLFIGKAGGYNGGYMDGLIDEAFIYKRVLTEGERTWLYNSGDGRTYSDLSQPPPTGTDPGVTNLVAWWTLDEESDTRVDSHSNNDLEENHYTVYSDSGKQGDAAVFAGGNSNLAVYDNSEISMGNIDFTIGGWVNIDTLGSFRGLMGKGPTTGVTAGYEYLLGYDSTPNKFWFSVGNGTTYGSVTNFTPSEDIWYFLVAWHDSVNDMIYLQVNNGTPASASYSGGSHDSSSNLIIGRPGEYFGGFMDGLIDEAFIYKRVLTSDERAWLYQSGYGQTYSDLAQSPTPTPTATFTPTSTPTFTPTATWTPSPTPTSTNLPFPNNGGEGTCWKSEASWPFYNAVYSIDTSTIPFLWMPVIEDAASTWTNITPSNFSLTRQQSSVNFIDMGIVTRPDLNIALTTTYFSGNTLVKVTTTFDENDNFELTPISGSYHVENVMTHEFGHWVWLLDIDTPGCEDVTMWHEGDYAETKKITLESADINAVNWQYP
ncbi:MAG: hypothetical protein KF758_02410 [Anaerolineales bacterium]|nr:hypothetical protein [Anaerolineales bacterium]MBX3035742.1 hypothetical protein [Anaerolineales bacterium]